MGSSSIHSNSLPVSGVVPNTVVELLNQQIAETIDLQLQATHAASSVKGPYAPELKVLFDGVARDLRETIDVIAGRIDTLGGQEVATVRIVNQQSHVRFSSDTFNANEHLQAMLSSHSKYESAFRRILKRVEELGDPESVLVLERIGVSIERNLWLLETYLEAVAVGLHGRKLPKWTPAFENEFRSFERHQRICSHGI